MRIDAHHSFTERYPLDHLGTILKRNRFEGSVLVYPGLPETPDFVKAIVVDGEFREEYLRHPKFRGIRTDSLKCCAELARLGLSLDWAGDVSEVPRIAERFPELRVVVENATGLEACATVYCKVSGLGDRSAVRQVLAAFDPAHLMFASHWPEHLPDVTWKATLAAFTQALGAQPMAIREELLGGTARRFYRIAEASAA